MDKKDILAENTPTPPTQTMTNFIANGAIYILGEFDSSISMNVIPRLVDLIHTKASEKDPVINIYINSYGGEVKELFGLLCLLQTAKAMGIKIITTVLGRACSCGSMLAVVGHERYMYKYAMHLAHLGIQSDAVTTNEQIERASKKWKWHFEQILDHYFVCTGCSKKKLEQILKDDSCWLTPEECIKYGFATKIIQ